MPPVMLQGLVVSFTLPTLLAVAVSRVALQRLLRSIQGYRNLPLLLSRLELRRMWKREQPWKEFSHDKQHSMILKVEAWHIYSRFSRLKYDKEDLIANDPKALK